MLLAVRFFTINDFFLIPLCYVIMYGIVRSRANANGDPRIRKLYFSAFYFKAACVLAYVIITEFYFGGGDTGLYYQAIKDLRTAVESDFNNVYSIIASSSLRESNTLAPYFLYDDYVLDVTYNYMQVPSNFFVPRLAYLPSVIFFNSYFCICLCFMMFALGGTIRLFKTFYHFYPNAKRELALAIFFLPSVGFWSAGLLKDTICFGAVGFFLYGALNVFIKKEKVIPSLIWMVIASYLLFMIKTYIFLVLVMAVTIWIFAETNKLIKDRTLRAVFGAMTFIIGISVGMLLYQYFTSQETLKQYQLDNIVSSAEKQRVNYALIDQSLEQKTSYYSINTGNPALLILNSVIATFFRPFPWEINSTVAVLSAIEAFAFLLLTFRLFSKKGIKRPFGYIFNEPPVLLCFVFALVFAVGVGASTANFGTLSRYKIPCMPFYMIMILMTYRNTGLQYPKWLNNILRKIK